MIEAVTYRVQGHSSSDDPSAYRDATEPEMWELRDPINHFRSYLKTRGIWSQDMETEIQDRHSEAITATLRASDQLGAPPLDSLFDDVYEQLPWNLVEQREYLLAQERTKSPHSH